MTQSHIRYGLKFIAALERARDLRETEGEAS
jgi:hypothetical protein